MDKLVGTVLREAASPDWAEHASAIARGSDARSQGVAVWRWLIDLAGTVKAAAQAKAAAAAAGAGGGGGSGFVGATTRHVVQNTFTLPPALSEEQLQMKDKAPLNSVSFQELQGDVASLPAEVRKWARSGLQPGEKGAPQAPSPIVQLNMADAPARELAKGNIACPAVADRASADLAAREKRGREVIERLLGEGLAPGRVVKKVLRAVQSLRLTLSPRPEAFQGLEADRDVLDNSGESLSISPELTFTILGEVAKAYWPEFDWNFYSTFRTTVQMAFETGGAAGRPHAAKVYTRALKQVELGADAARMASTLTRTLVSQEEESKFVKWAREGRDQGRAIDVAIAASSLGSTRRKAAEEGAGKGAGAGAGKGGVAATISTHVSPAGRRCDVATGPEQVKSWLQKFQKLCFWYNISGKCTPSGTNTCTRTHTVAPKPEFDAWVEANGGTLV